VFVYSWHNLVAVDNAWLGEIPSPFFPHSIASVCGWLVWMEEPEPVLYWLLYPVKVIKL